MVEDRRPRRRDTDVVVPLAAGEVEAAEAAGMDTDPEADAVEVGDDDGAEGGAGVWVCLAPTVIEQSCRSCSRLAFRSWPTWFTTFRWTVHRSNNNSNNNNHNSSNNNNTRGKERC